MAADAKEVKAMFASVQTNKLGTLSLSQLETVATQHNLKVLDLKDHKITAIPKEVLGAFAHVTVLD